MRKRNVYKYGGAIQNINNLYSEGIYDFKGWLQAKNNLLLALKKDLFNQIKSRNVTKNIEEVLPELTNYTWYPYELADKLFSIELRKNKTLPTPNNENILYGTSYTEVICDDITLNDIPRNLE